MAILFALVLLLKTLVYFASAPSPDESTNLLDLVV
jgi:hypothetical protein